MEDKSYNSPLVTISIITYNSESYILETLQSVLIQSYENVELIISDDGSTDKTISISEEWLATHHERFVNSKIITTKVNTGIPANCNRALSAACGEWIKLIAGDDILLPDCIGDLLNFCKKNGYKHAVSDVICLQDGNQYYNGYYKKEMERFFELNVHAKYKYYVAYPFPINSPSLLFEKKIVQKLQPFDESFHILEDQPYFFTLLKNNVDIGYLQKATVIYRVHSKSVTGIVNINFFKTLYECYLKYRKPNIANDGKGRLLKFLIERHFERQIFFNDKNSLWQKAMIALYNLLIRRLSSTFLYNQKDRKKYTANRI